MSRSSGPAIPDGFLRRLARGLPPVEGWGTFRAGARPAAVVAILHRRQGAWHIPFVVRRADLASHPGQVGLPGGGVRGGETAWAAAAREAEEEIGVARTALVALGAGPELYTTVSNYSVAPFVAWLPGSDAAFRAGAGEVEAVLEVPLAVLLDEAAWRDGPPPWPGPHLPVAEQVIWGLTARLLAALLPPIAAALRGE